jgi:hypothetical protein
MFSQSIESQKQLLIQNGIEEQVEVGSAANEIQNFLIIILDSLKYIVKIKS